MVERGGADPDDRYPDAATMRAALADAGRAMPPPQPLVLAGLSGEISTADPTQIGRSSRLYDQDAPAPEPVPEVVTPRRRERTPGSFRWVGAVVAGVVVLALLAAGVAVAGTGGGGNVTVPSLVGLSTKDATDRVAAAGSR
ncbi:MAG: hypothetical protein U0W40_07390 [Acidimicrobiia bacterium]